ncbi:hypothetical protein GSI_14688 [Ganoderma sinense ZZ0214-1]|uniref:Uncharacterized protein n=1 Tax=Ganoderma sinense ZZ0214-1 TaxID=1077348 RepID=A0A2G8RPE6_9APHY|nr:hypothetical protein GSI_14688 [Ganoderma sinense ZZ0214-1]
MICNGSMLMIDGSFSDSATTDAAGLGSRDGSRLCSAMGASASISSGSACVRSCCASSTAGGVRTPTCEKIAGTPDDGRRSGNSSASAPGPPDSDVEARRG